MQFYPSPYWKSVVERRTYRWVFRGGKGSGILYNKRSNKTYDTRVAEADNTLSIENIQSEDEGRYYVECWYGNPIQYIYSSSVDLKLQEPFFTTTKATDKGTTITSGKFLITIQLLMLFILLFGVCILFLIEITVHSMQTVQTLIRHVLWRLTWVCIFCLVFLGTQGING